MNIKTGSMPELTSASVVRTRREQLGLSREQLAGKAETSLSTIIRLENHDKLPTVATLVAVADVLGLSLDDIARPGR